MTDNTNPDNAAPAIAAVDANAAPAADANKPAADANVNADANKPAADAPKADANVDANKPAADADKPAADPNAPKPDADKDAKKDDKAAIRAPEKYEDFKLPDGAALAPEVKSKFEAVVRELDLPQAEAQKLLALAPDVGQMFNKQLDDKIAQATVTWKETSRVDKEIGGSGDQKTLDTNMAFVAKARDAYATPEFLKMLEPFDAKNNPEGTGFGNHPEVVRLLMRVGKSIGADNKVVVGNGSPDTRTAAEKLYSKTTPKT